MGQDQGQERTRVVAADEAKSPEQLRDEIAEVREDLGDTAAALAAKTDVKSRAREKADDVKRTAVSKKDEMVSKLRRSTPAGGDEAVTSGPSTATQIRTKAQQNPVLTAAFGAFAGGFLLGRLSRRPGD
jgi:vacuolar-type H+-ATPase subunit H